MVSSSSFYLILILFLLLESSTALKKNGSLIIRGTQNSIADFTGINPNIKDDLRYIELEYINFDPDELIEALRDCHNLEYLHLRRLNESQWKFTKRVTLPSLKEFTLDFPAPEDGTTTEEQFKSMIFFDKNGDWKFEQIHTLNTDIKITQHTKWDGVDKFHLTLFEINHSEGKFVSRLESFIEKLLPNLENNFEVKKFLVTDWVYVENATTLDPNWIQPSVREMELGNVRLKEGGSMSELLARPKSLEQLSLLGVQAPLDIAGLPSHSLRKLQVDGMEVVNVSRIVQFEKLTTLAYSYSPIPNFFVRNYSDIFPNVKFVYFGMGEHNYSLRLLRNILGTCAQKISLLHFNWGKHCKNKSEEEDSGMIEFLKTAGVTLCDPLAFGLIKNKTTGQWKLNTENSEVFDNSFKVGVDVPDTIEGEGELNDCGVNNYKP